MGRKAQPDLLLVSHSLGYNGDLMYHGETFAELQRLVPGLAIAVDPREKHRNPHGLWLVPLFRLFWIEHSNAGGYTRQAFNIASPLLAWRVARLKPGVLMTMEFTPVVMLAILGSLFSPRTRRVQLVESDPTFWGGGKSPLVTMLSRWAVRRAHVVMTSNAAGARYCREVLHVPEEKLVIAPYQVSGPPGAGVKRTKGDGPLRLVFANGLVSRKNPGLILEALALLPPEIAAQVELTIAGDGEERATLEQQARDTGIADRVHFVGRVPYSELGKYLGPADVAISPTRIDFRSLASFEGLAFGCAVLVSDADGALFETVIEGETGFTFPSGNAAALADRIVILARDRRLLAAMQERALALFLEKYSNERAARNYAAAAAQAADA